MINLSIENEGYTYNPPVLDGIKWSTERQGVPGKLTFEVVKNGDLNFQEGNPVKLYVDEKPVFFGFVFQKKRDKGETISVTAYD